MRLFKATIEVLVAADDEAAASDAISEALSTKLLRDRASGWKDWQYCQTHNGEFQRDPGPKRISKKEALEQFAEFDGSDK